MAKTDEELEDEVRRRKKIEAKVEKELKDKESAKSARGCLFVVIFLIFCGYLLTSGDDAGQPEKPLTVEEQRTKTIERAFSSWDGSHRATENRLKSALKDPDSYEHIETKYNDNGDHIAVLLKYRARNSFGGMTIGYVKSTATIDGKLLTFDNVE